MFYLLTGIRNIKRQKYKSILSILISIVIVLLLNVYIGNIDSIRKQLKALPDAIPISARVSNLNGSMDAGLAIKSETVEGIEDSDYIKEPVITVQLMMGFGEFTIENYEGKLNLFVSGVNNRKGVSGLKKEEITWAEGSSEDFFASDKNECIMNQELMERNGYKIGERVTLTAFYYRYGDYHQIFIDPLNIREYKIVGTVDMMEYKGSVVQPDVIVPYNTVKEAFVTEGLTFTADSASFTVKNPFHLNELKGEMKDLGFLPVIAAAEYQYDGNALTIRDSTFVQAAEQLEESQTLLETGMPFIIALVAFIGYITAYLLIHSRRAEYAIMRSVGMRHMQCFIIMFLENAAVIMAGCILGSLMALWVLGTDMRVLGQVAGLFLAFYLSGSAIALWNLGKLSVMDVITKND